MSDDKDDVCLHKGVRVPNGPYLRHFQLRLGRLPRRCPPRSLPPHSPPPRSPPSSSLLPSLTTSLVPGPPFVCALLSAHTPPFCADRWVHKGVSAPTISAPSR